MKKEYETPQVQTLMIFVEQGFAISGTIDNPIEETESPDYWS